MNAKKYFLPLIIIIINLATYTYSQNTEYIYTATWNLENLFDTIDDADTKDEEFTPNGAKNWTEEKLTEKIYNLSRVIKYMNELRGPDILGVQEVEHEHLLKTLLEKHFCDRNYKIVYKESLDGRGIDNGLIYNADKFTFIEKELLEVKLKDGWQTRYILRVRLKHNKNEIISVFVNHWPSRSGGQERSEPGRIIAAETLKDKLEQIKKNQPNEHIIILGDFNDEPINTSLQIVEKADGENKLIRNLSKDLAATGKGSYKFADKWNMLDQILISKNFEDGIGIEYVNDSFEIISPEFALTKTGSYKGTFRPTFGGRNYLGGFSDHFPVGALFKFIQ
ncbi:MAG: endonuclease/exonuclease/phosphatase family protein [Bacteroidota bacterium]